MTSKQFNKFAVGDLVYRYPSTEQRAGDAGIVVRVMVVQEGDEPHVEFQRPDGSNSPILDCSKVGYGGPPPREIHNASAIVKGNYPLTSCIPPGIFPRCTRSPMEGR